MKQFSKTATAGGGNSNIFVIFTPNILEDEPILTSICFKGVGNHQLDSRIFFFRVFVATGLVFKPLMKTCV